MRFSGYLKNSVWDYLLCLMMSVGLTINVFQGYYIPDGYISNVKLLTGVCAIFLILFFICAYNRKSIIFSIASFLIASGIGIYWVQKSQIAAQKDFSIDHYMFWILSFALSLSIFLLSRTKITTIFLFILGAYTLACVPLLGYKNYVWGFIVFLTACAAMFFYKVYRHNVLHTDTVKTSFTSFFTSSAVISAIAVGLAGLSFVFIIKPMNPPSAKLILYTRLMSFEILEKIGVSSKMHLYNQDLTSNKENDSERTSKNEGQNESDTPDNEKQNQNDEVQKNNNTKSNKTVYYTGISYEKNKYINILLIFLITILIVSPFFIKLYLRRRWLAKTLEKSQSEQVLDFYRFFFRKMRLVGFKKPIDDTLFEYLDKVEPRLKFFKAGEVDLRTLTDVFVKVNYGENQPNDEECRMFSDFYAVFHKNCRKYLGAFKYSLRFFAL